MAKTSAERQAEYRARTDKERINIMVDVSTKNQLIRLSKHLGVTQADVLSLLLQTAENRITQEMTSDMTTYYDVTAYKSK